MSMQTNGCTILIGGTSHTGKSTLAAELSGALGWEAQSTDTMARHPGRPWPDVRPHVREFYESLSENSIHTFLLHHHANMWPALRTLLKDRLHGGDHLVLEGSALRPEYMAGLSDKGVLCICLSAPASLIVDRIHANAGYNDMPPERQLLVDAFVTRSLRDNAAVLREAKAHGVTCIDVSDQTALANQKALILRRAEQHALRD